VGATPGIVLALTAPSRPTPMTAQMAAPVVSRLRRRMAASRARTLDWVVSLGSMTASLDPASKPSLRGSWDITEKNGRSWSIDTPALSLDTAPVPAPAAISPTRNPPLPAQPRAVLGAARSALIHFERAAPIAQGIEQDGPNVKVGGSIPSGGTYHEFFSGESESSGCLRLASSGDLHSSRHTQPGPSASRSPGGGGTSQSGSQSVSIPCGPAPGAPGSPMTCRFPTSP
jgi:hypothetical protein